MLVRHRTPSVRQHGSLDRASRSAERQRGLKRTGTRTSDMSRHERRLQQVDDRHDGHSDIDERRRVRLHQRLVRERDGAARGRIDAMGRARGDYESGQRQEKSTYKKSVQKADGATVWMDASVTRHRVQFGSVRSQCRQTVPRALLPGRCKDRGGRRETARGRRRRRRRRRKRTVFRHQTQQRFHVSFDGSVEIPRHDQLPRSRVQLRQVSESVRMRGDERSFPIRVHGSTGETRRHRSTAERGLLQSTEERRYFRRGLRQLSGGVARQRYDDVARLSRLV